MNNALHQRWLNGLAPFDGCIVRFDADELTPLPALRQALLVIVPALQERWPDTELSMLDDWHEHDGYVNGEQPVTWQELLQRIGDDETTMAFTHGDWGVRLAFFPDDYGFYLRVYIPDEDEQDYPERRGDFDVTCAPELVSALADHATAASKLPVAKTGAKLYFDRRYSRWLKSNRMLLVLMGVEECYRRPVLPEWKCYCPREGQFMMTQLPVNPNATPEARALLDQIYQMSGHSLWAGQHNTPAQMSEYSDQAEEITGKYPLLWGQDFGFHADDMDGIIFRQGVMDEAKRQHAAGSVITLMWHTVRPTEEEPGTFKDNVCGKVTDAEWEDLLTPGTEIYERWVRQTDRIAGFLTQLKEAHIPVLWRPYHEMNGDWFWWGKRGGPTGYAALYKQMYERFVHAHHLDNLLWVWNANAPAPHILAYPECYPGHEFADVLATDVYRGEFYQSHYDDLVTLAEGRPVALGEVGQLPTPAVLDSQPLWAWFMVWTNHLTNANTPEAVREIYNDPRVLTRP